MAQAIKKKNGNDNTRSLLTGHVTRGLREGALFMFLALALYLLVSLVTYDPADPGWSHIGPSGEIANAGGVAGAWFADVFLYLFGYLAYLIPVMAGYTGWMIFRERSLNGNLDVHQIILRWFGFFVTLGAGTGLATLHFTVLPGTLPLNAGGVLGDLVGKALVGAFSFLGATLFLLALFLGGVTLFTGLSWVRLMDFLGRITLQLLRNIRYPLLVLKDRMKGWRARSERQVAVKIEKKKVARRPPLRIEPVINTVEPSPRLERERQVELFESSGDGTGFPPLSLLDEAPPRKGGYSPEVLEAMSRQVELKLKDFGVEVQVVGVLPGPVITRFELQPAPGVKVSQITNLAKDLARSLSVVSVRVVEVIPGKSVVGLEIPNEQREMVFLSEILKSRDYDEATSPLTLALGKDISGQPVVADLARMPHLLVAGTTGSGKSVGLNGMVVSMLYKTSAKDVRLIMIDPKMLELSVYQGIPHLLAPVVTDMKEAANALRWCVVEMDRRYKLMAALGVRNLAGYNRKVRDAIASGTPIPDPFYKPSEAPDPEQPVPTLEPMPFIVVVVDELADMIMIVGKKVEELIARLAQKARASGIHLILATQRPSVDVITGLIKANIPTRIAFQVSSKVDSRTILDQMGAEQLLGHGDMLYLPPGTGLPQRIHGAFVSDQEVHRVVEYLRKRGRPEYVEEILRDPSEYEGGGGGVFAGEGGEGSEADPLYDQAVRIVTESRRASISGVQRRLKIGYNRAARMIEEMERAGIVGPLQPNGSREVLVAPPPED